MKKIRNMSLRQEVAEYVEQWAARTEELLQQKLSSWKARHSDALYQAVRMHVIKQAEGVIGVSLHFPTYGRFVDMGVGRGRSQARLTQEKYRTRFQKKKERHPRPWYSRTYFARVRQLNEVLSLKLIEESIAAIVHEQQDLIISTP